jgi:hypothetical protein
MWWLTSDLKTKARFQEIMVFCTDEVGRDEQLFDNLMKGYRALQSEVGGVQDEFRRICKVCQVVFP